ncbi:MAG: 2-oxoacid:ferredoxin oxidoreductase subunit beta, partial [Caldilineae bacterium]
EEIEIEDYEDEVEVELHDGSKILLKKLDPSHDPTDRRAAFDVLDRAHREGKLLTGLFYVTEDEPDLNELLHTTETPLAYLPQEKLRPSRETLEKVVASM